VRCNQQGGEQVVNKFIVPWSVNFTHRCTMSKCVWNSNIKSGCDRASQNLHPSDADFIWKIRRMRMRICHRSKFVSASYYS